MGEIRGRIPFSLYCGLLDDDSLDALSCPSDDVYDASHCYVEIREQPWTYNTRSIRVFLTDLDCYTDHAVTEWYFGGCNGETIRLENLLPPYIVSDAESVLSERIPVVIPRFPTSIADAHELLAGLFEIRRRLLWFVVNAAPSLLHFCPHTENDREAEARLLAAYVEFEFALIYDTGRAAVEDGGAYLDQSGLKSILRDFTRWFMLKYIPEAFDVSSGGV